MKRILIIVVILISSLLVGCGKKKNAEDFMNKGLECFLKEDYDGAIENYLIATSMDPKSAMAYNYLGISYRFKYNLTRNRDFKINEEEAFKKSVELDPNFWVALINLASTYYYDNRQAEAIPLFEKALKLNPEHPEKADIENLIKNFKSGGHPPYP